MNTIEHKGIVGTVEFSEQDSCFFASVVGIRDLLITEAETVSDLKKNFERIVDEYLAECKAEKRKPEKQASGNFQVRVSPRLHALAKARAAGEPRKTSLNDVVETALKNYLDS